MLKVGEIIGDYTVLEDKGRRHNQRYFLVECNVCGHKKEVGSSNFKRQNSEHSSLNCKEDYYKNLLGEKFGDYEVIDYIYAGTKGYKLKIKCKICGHELLVGDWALKNNPHQHNQYTCEQEFVENEIGKIYGDYKIISLNKATKYCLYFNVECVKCHTTGIRSLSALKRSSFKHGMECFKMIDGKYKNEFERRFANIKARCNNPNAKGYKNYGARGIKVEYEHLADFYLDFIDEFTKHVEIYGIHNTSFDRINVNGNYTKNNLRLTTQAVQSTNTRRKKYFILEKDGVYVLSDNAMEFGKKFGANGRSIGNLVRGASKSANGWRLIAKSSNLEDLEGINVTTKLITT